MMNPDTSFIGEILVKEAINEKIIKHEIIGGTSYFTCTLCKSTMSGIIPTKSHLEGSSHEKMKKKALSRIFLTEASLSNLKLCSENGSTSLSGSSFSDQVQDEVLNALKKKIVKQSEDGDKNHLYCNVCKCQCTGEKSMSEHLQGSSHAKKLRLYSRSETPSIERYNSSPGVVHENVVPCNTPSQLMAFLGDVPKETHSPQYSVILKEAMDKNIVEREENHLVCKVCQQPCTGEENMLQHLSGKSHAKRLSLNSRMDPSSIGSVGSSPERQHENLVACNTPSQLQVSGNDIPKERQSLLSSDIVREALEMKIVENEGNHLQCKICDQACTGEENMIQHLTGRVHAKKIRLQQLMDARTIKDTSSGISLPACQRSPDQSLSLDMDKKELYQVPPNMKHFKIYLPSDSLDSVFDM